MARFLTFRRFLVLGVLASTLLVAALGVAVVLGLMSIGEAALVGFVLLTFGAIGALGLGIRRMDRRLRSAVGDHSKLTSLETRTKNLAKQYADSLRQVKELLQELRGELGAHRVELLEAMTQLESERAAPRASAIVTPRRSPIAEAGPRVDATVQRKTGPGGSIATTDDSTVVLTFDDGPDPVTTPTLLDLLRKHDVTATFFLIGNRAHMHPSLVRRIADEGHVLANHSWTHRMDIASLSDEELAAELTNTNEAILAAAPNTSIDYFRAPHGNFDKRLVAVAASYGMQSIYWDVDPRDWAVTPENKDERVCPYVDPRDWGVADSSSGPTMVHQIVRAVTGKVRPGSIVLSHDYRTPDTIVAYRILLPWLKDNFKIGRLPLGGPR